MGTENKGNQGAQAEKHLQAESHAVERSISEFFTNLSKTFDQFRNTHPGKEDIKIDNPLSNYSDAFSGFAQNNVSKSEGFSIRVPVNAAYEEFVRKAVIQGITVE